MTYEVGFTFFASLQLDMARLWLAISVLMALPHVIILPVVLHAWRSQMRAIEAVQEQLRRFDFHRDTACHCCAVKHIHPQTGKMMLCDRKILAESVATWFGSISDFETVVQEKVSVVFQESRSSCSETAPNIPASLGLLDVCRKKEEECIEYLYYQNWLP